MSRIKWDRPSGVREKVERDPGTATMCEFHRTGIPVWAMGKRFYKAGCLTCIFKAEKDPTLMTAATPAQLLVDYKAGRRLTAAKFAAKVDRIKRYRDAQIRDAL